MSAVVTGEGVIVEVANPEVVVEVSGTQGAPGTPGIQGPPGDLTKPVADARYHKNLLTTAQWWVDAGAVAADGLSLTDLSGRNRPAVFGTAAQKPIVLPYAGVPYWYEPDPKAAAGTILDLSSVPSAVTSVQFVIQGSLTHRTDRDAQVVQYGSTTNGLIIYSDSGGKVSSRAFIAGSGAILTLKASGGFSSKAWHRFTYTLTSGVVTYEDSSDGAAWTQIGTTTHATQPNPLSASTCRIGAGSTSQSVPGTRYYVSCTVDGVKVAEFDPKNWNTNYTQVTNTGTAGGNWTFTRATSTTAPRGVIVDRPIVLFGGGQKADVAGYQPNGDAQPLTVLVAVRDFAAAGDSNNYIEATSGGANTQTGWFIYKSGPSILVKAKDGTSSNQPWFSVLSPIIGVISGTISKASITPYVNGVKGDPGVVALTTTKPDTDMSIGRYSGKFEFLAAAVFERQLTDAEIAQASNELMGTPHYAQPDPHGQYVLESTTGNLLTPNQASVETDTTGFDAGTMILTASTDWAMHGTKSLKVQVNGTGWPMCSVGSNNASRTAPVTPGVAYTVIADCNVGSLTASPRGWLQLLVDYYTTADVVIGSTVAVPLVNGKFSYTGVAPANAARIYIRIGINANPAVVGEVFYVDRIGLWAGAGGNWAMPGVPISNLGTKVEHPNVDDVAVYTWDAGKGRWQLTHYDSGVRDIKAMLTNGWTSSGPVYLRRDLTTLRLWGQVTSAAATDAVLIPGAGWPPGFGVAFGANMVTTTRDTSTGVISAFLLGYGLATYGQYGAGQGVKIFNCVTEVESNIPTSLPGVLYSAAPA